MFQTELPTSPFESYADKMLGCVSEPLQHSNGTGSCDNDECCVEMLMED